MKRLRLACACLLFAACGTSSEPSGTPEPEPGTQEQPPPRGMVAPTPETPAPETPTPETPSPTSRPPVPVIDVDRSEGAAPLIVRFDGSRSTDPDDDLVQLSWDFGDGSFGLVGTQVVHTFTNPGVFTVTLVAADLERNNVPATVMITVREPPPPPPGNNAPVAVLNASTTGGEAPVDVTFSAAGSTDPDGDALTYAWDFGDGAAGQGVEVAHRYTTAGSFTARLVVTDPSGTQDTTAQTIVVTAAPPPPPPPMPRPPMAAATSPSTQGAAPFTVFLDGRASTDPDNDISGYAWSFGDGSPNANGPTTNHTYGTEGTYTVTLTVIDATGQSSTDTLNIVVTPPPATCPMVSGPQTMGTVTSQNLPEVSGMVASRSQPGVLWVHNDSGDGPRIYAINTQGQLLAGYELAGINAADWEDISIGPGPNPNQDYLYIGDIGDNSEQATVAVVHRIPEPNVPSAAPALYTLSNIEVIGFQYANGNTHNAEALMVDPVGGDLLIFTKSASGVSLIYRATPPFQIGQVNSTDYVGGINFAIPGYPGTGQVTGGDISPSGDRVLIRTYNLAYFWERAPGTNVVDAFGSGACLGALAQEPQGEAIAFLPNSTGYYSLSEGSAQPLYQYTF